MARKVGTGKSKIIEELKNKDLNSGVGSAEEIRKSTIEIVKHKNPLIVTNLKDAKILCSRVIYLLQQDKIETVKAKAIMYALTVYITCYRECDFELKLDKILKLLGISEDI